MKILIAGGTGLIGNKLSAALAAAGHTITVLSRKGGKNAHENLRHLTWNGKEIPDALVGPQDAVINLAGAGIADKRWTIDYKKLLEESRLNATRACLAFIQRQNPPPSVFINASAVGYYGVKNARAVTETDPAGNDFLGKLCAKWEAAAQGLSIRTVIPRLGIVMAKEGGAFPRLLSPFKYYAGGYVGSGTQGFPWVHIDDAVGALIFALENENVSGPINIAAPDFLTNRQFATLVGKILHLPSGISIPAFIVKAMMGESSVILLDGQFVRSDKIRSLGYEFKFPTGDAAIRDLLVHP